jgi:serine/threonine protein kinase
MDFKEFTVDSEIGHGSFGLVHKAMWRGTEVAIKRLPRESITEQQVYFFFFLGEGGDCGNNVMGLNICLGKKKKKKKKVGRKLFL